MVNLIMVKNNFAKFFLIVLATIFICGCNNMEEFEELNATSQEFTVSEDTSGMVEAEVLKESIPYLQGFLNSQYDYLIGTDKTPQWDKYLSSTIDPNRSIVLKNDIDLMVSNFLKVNDARFYKYTSELKTGDLTTIKYDTENGLWFIDKLIDENHVYDSKQIDDDMELARRYGFFVKKENGVWKIQDWIEYGLVGGTKREEGGIRWWYSADVYETVPLTRSSSSNRSAAQTYALNHVYNPSSNYPDYSNYGGDCTNFVSQCLEAGGWTKVNDGNRYSSYSWFHPVGSTMPSESLRSASWTSASYLYNFLNANSDRAVPASYPLSSYEIGDVVQLYSTSYSPAWHHSMIITYASGGTIKVTYRNANSSGSPGKNIDINLFSDTKKFWKIVYWKHCLT